MSKTAKSAWIANLSKGQFPKERMAVLGAEMLSDTELIALLLNTGSKDKNVMQVAAELLNQTAGSLRTLRTWSLNEIKEIDGIGESKGARILAALELGKRAALEDKGYMPKINSSQDVLDLLADEMRTLEKETVRVLLLNSKNLLLHTATISVGGLNYSTVHPREVFKAALKFSAAAIILVHNHPSGEYTPSEQDYHLTKRLKEAGEIMGIPLLDHIIIAESGYYSFSEKKMIQY